MFAASDHQGVASILIGWGILSTACILTDSHAISLIYRWLSSSTSAPIPDLQCTAVVLWQAFWWDRAWIFEEYSISILSQQNFGNGRMHATFGLHESQVAKHMIAPIASFDWIHRILFLVLGMRSAAESCCIGFISKVSVVLRTDLFLRAQERMCV